MLYPSGVTVSVRIYSPASKPVNSNFVLSASSSVVIVYSLTTFFEPSLSTFSNLKAAPVSGCLLELILLMITLYVNTITLSVSV